MGKRSLRTALSVSGVFILLLLVLIIMQASGAAPVSAQTLPCVDPATGAECTPTPPSPTCGIPGLPPCDNPTAIPPTDIPANTPVPVFIPPTFTPTVTITPTTVSIIPTLPEVTPIPTGTPFPTPTPKAVPPFMLAPLPNLIGLLHPPESLVAKLPAWLSPFNIKLSAIEITQGIQCMHDPNCPDNSVPLYSGKTTLVRAYVSLTGGPQSYVDHIGGVLCYGSTGAGGCANPIQAVKKITVFYGSDPVHYGRYLADDSLDFILPANFVTALTPQTFTVYVNYQFKDLPSEAFYSDNYKSLTYQVTASKPIYVMFHPVQNKGVMPPAMEWATLTDYLVKTYPTGQFYPSLGIPLYGKDYAWTIDDKWGCPKGWHDLINDLWYLRGGSGPIAYGEVPYQTLSGNTGCGVFGGPEAGGIAGATIDGRTAAQEVGHTLNLPHVPGCGAGGPDMSYPFANGLLDEYGIDPITLKVYAPVWSFDFMGYCGKGTNTWVSMFTYNEIAARLPSGAYLPSEPHLASLVSVVVPQQVLVGSGDLSPTSASLTQGFYLVDRSSFNALTPDAGPYTVELQDVSGKVIYSQHFDLSQMSNDTPQTEGGFQLVLPWLEGAKKVVFKYQDQVIGHTLASAHAPTLTLTAPAGGETWAATGQQTITWSASDADHNPLSYMVQYSADGGKTWMMLAANLKDPSFTFDGDYLPGSDHGVIRVIASDGFNTTQVDSNQVTVAPKSALIAITSPADSASIEEGSPVILQAAGTDVRDGPITNVDQFTWSSDRDGSLGSGNPLILSNLSTGAHTLTLSVQNSSGLVSTASVHITITPPVSSKNTNGTGLIDFLPLILVFVFLVAGIIVAGILIRRRKISKV